MVVFCLCWRCFNYNSIFYSAIATRRATPSTPPSALLPPLSASLLCAAVLAPRLTCLSCLSMAKYPVKHVCRVICKHLHWKLFDTVWNSDETNGLPTYFVFAYATLWPIRPTADNFFPTAVMHSRFYPRFIVSRFSRAHSLLYQFVVDTPCKLTLWTSMRLWFLD